MSELAAVGVALFFVLVVLALWFLVPAGDE